MAPAKKTLELIARAYAALLTCAVLPTCAAAIPDRCFAEAGALFQVDRAVLRAIAQLESSGRCPVRHPRNQDGTYDIGCMGINSSWLPELETRFHISEYDLHDACVNVHVGAWIHARNVGQFGDTWQAIGAYGAVSEPKRIEYAWKIHTKLSALRQD